MSEAILGRGERWIDGGEGRYSVNRKGEVFSYVRGKRKKMTPARPFCKKRKIYLYPMVCLFLGKPVNKYVHRLVAQAFIPNPENKPTVNHIDGDKTNNHVKNLEWASSQEQSDHAWETGLRERSPYKDWDNETRKSVFVEYKKDHKDKYLPRIVEECGVPPEILKIPIIKRNLLDTWAYYYKMFRLCDNQEISSAKIAEIMGLDLSMVSLVRRGKRAIQARKIYDKYKNDRRFVVIC